MPPENSFPFSITCKISDSCPTFAFTAIPSISLAVSSAPSIFISTATTDWAHAFLKVTAKAFPIPLAAPVTTTLLFLTCILYFLF